MSEESLHAIPHPTRIGSRMQTEPIVPVRPLGLDPRLPSVSALGRRLTAPMVRLGDQIILTAALFLTILNASLSQGQSVAGFLEMRISIRNLSLELGLLIAWRCIFWMVGLYQPRLNRSFGDLLFKVPATVLICTGVILFPVRYSHQSNDLVHSCFIFWFVGTVLMLSSRAAVYTYEEHIRPAFRRRRTVLICGTGLRARLLAQQLASDRDFRYQLAGFIDSHPQPDCSRIGPVLGGTEDLESILMRLPVDEVIISLPIKSQFAEIEEIVGICGRAGIQTQYSMDLFTTDVAKRSQVDATSGTRVVLEMVHQDERLLLKGVFDRVLSAIGLVLLLPVFLAVAIGVRLSSPGPVFFVQQRFGLGKRKFGMIKFRSMVPDAEARQAALEHLNEIDGPTFKMKRDPRVTPFGAFIRKTSIDELPQLLNVLKGDMSLVGPRPLPSRDVERFSEAWLMRRFSVKPGITGLWQVSGRSNTDFDNAIKLDLRYIDRWSLGLDIKILLRTLFVVAKGRGAY